MDKQQSPVTQTYAHYAAVVAARGVTPMTEAQFAEFQSLPRVADVPMPHSLNYAIGVALEAGDTSGALQLINQCDEHDKECWTQYTTVGDHFPAGGLWFNHLQWSKFDRVEARPLNVAHMLDFNGDVIGELTFFNIGSESCFFDKDSVCFLDEENGWEFLFYHETANPTLDQILELTKPHFGE
ncbi:hypothetical protein [Pseudomonas sp. P8_250]|uniref:hypothetical protein n=1 Tax=Pseudomonas sp. P8_250 TaxID=3043446 RepID=UPI002A371019|nr:hypothetical protein [Pseudomonas sp. P8_250]MDX9668733.1 hypothetical protein [Pseudomonas sp. P8_250]